MLRALLGCGAAAITKILLFHHASFTTDPVPAFHRGAGRGDTKSERNMTHQISLTLQTATHFLAGSGLDPRVQYLSGVSSYGYGLAVLLALCGGFFLPRVLKRYFPIEDTKVFLKVAGGALFFVFVLVGFRLLGSAYEWFLFIDVATGFAFAFTISWIRMFAEAKRRHEIELTWE